MKLDVAAEPNADGSEIHLLVRLTAPHVAAERGPVNLTLAIDRSSSMRGPRLSKAIDAANSLVDRLTDRDRIAVLAFDAAPQVVFGPALMTADNRELLRTAVAALDDGIGTNLSAAIKKGSELLRSGFVRGAISRLILLTDGQASIGITDSARLADIVTAEHERGVTLTTMGIGETFDDALLAELAQRGRGGFYYLASPADIPTAFGRELSGVFDIAARATELKFVPSANVTAVELLHRLPARPAEDGMIVEVGEVAGDSPRQILFRIRRNMPTSSGRLGTLAVSYRNADDSPGDGHIVGVELAANRDPASFAEATLERIRLEVAAVVDGAWAQRASGDNSVALQLLGNLRRVVRSELAGRNETDVRPLLDDLAAAEDAITNCDAEREKVRRALRERSQVALLGHSVVQSLPRGEED